MLVERRRSALPVELFARVAIAWALVSAVLIAVNWSAIAGQRFPDPDDVMRLLQVRDWIAGQGWFDVTQYRADAVNGGVTMHWSRLTDIPLALVIVTLTPIFGASAAESAALVIVPLFTLGIAMLLAARIAWRLMGDEEATLAALVLAVSIPALFQLAPMRIDHHGWQIICALAAVNALMSRHPPLGGWAIGASCAVWLTISIEGLPLIAAIFGVLGLRWLRDRNSRPWLIGATQSLAVFTSLLYLATRGIGDFTLVCDAVGPMHLALFGWVAVVLTLLGRFEPLPSALRIGGMGLAIGGGLAAVLYTAPQCATGGFAGVDPFVRDNWFAYVSARQPIWQQSLGTALQYAVTPLVGVFATMNLAHSSRDWLRRFWSDYMLILIAAFVVSVFVARAGAVACVLAAPPLAWQVREWLRGIRLMRRPAPRLAAMLGVTLALLPAFPVMLLAGAIPANASLKSTVASQPPMRATECRIDRLAQALEALPEGEVFAPLDIAPRVLLDTKHGVVATGHHRGDNAMRVVIETALGSSEQARDTFELRGTDYVALCSNLGEVQMYAEAAPDGFIAQLTRGEVPNWLEPVPVEGSSGLTFWRIVQD